MSRGRNRHVLVVRVQPGGNGIVQVCCFCRPRSATDRTGEPVTDWVRLNPDEIQAVYHEHRASALRR